MILLVSPKNKVSLIEYFVNDASISHMQAIEEMVLPLCGIHKHEIRIKHQRSLEEQYI